MVCPNLLKNSPTGFFSFVTNAFLLIIISAILLPKEKNFTEIHFLTCIYSFWTILANISTPDMGRETQSMARQRFPGNPVLIREEGPKIAPYWGRSCGVCTSTSTWGWRASWPFTQFVGGGCLWIWASCCLNSAFERQPPQWVTQDMVAGQGGRSGRY